jgi:putative Mg2+ transporter-C (MgtC) family protein
VGAVLFTIFSIKAGDNRIVANILTGIGFIGAGVIMRESGRVTGLTTAAMIWLVASLGMGLGFGNYLFVGVVTGITLVVMWLFPRLENYLEHAREHHTYEIVFPTGLEKLDRLQALFGQCGLRTEGQRQGKEGERMRCTWEAYGPPQAHERLMQALVDDPEVSEFRY